MPYVVATLERPATTCGLLAGCEQRRPAGLISGGKDGGYDVPMKGDLLWVYEGLTNYLGEVLAPRSGIWTAEDYRESLANERLRGGVLRFQRNWCGGRDGALGQYATDATLDEVVEGPRSFEAMRQKLAATKDRVTVLADALVPGMRRHLARRRAEWERDVRRGVECVVPPAYARKHPGAQSRRL